MSDLLRPFLADSKCWCAFAGARRISLSRLRSLLIILISAPVKQRDAVIEESAKAPEKSAAEVSVA